MSSAIKHWGEFPDFASEKQVNNIRDYVEFTPERRAKLDTAWSQTLASSNYTTVCIEQSCISRTVALLEYTDNLKTLIKGYRAGKVTREYMKNYAFKQHQVQALTMQHRLLNNVTMGKPRELTSSARGIPQNLPELSRATAHVMLRKTICAMLRVMKITYIEDLALETFVNGLEEFYDGLLQRANQQALVDYKFSQHKKPFTLSIMEKAYNAATKDTLCSLKEYYRGQVVAPHQKAVRRFNRVNDIYKNITHSKDKDVIKVEKCERPKSPVLFENFSDILSFDEARAEQARIDRARATSELETMPDPVV